MLVNILFLSVGSIIGFCLCALLTVASMADDELEEENRKNK